MGKRIKRKHFKRYDEDVETKQKKLSNFDIQTNET